MPSEVTKRLRDRRLQVWEQCKEMAETAAGENRSFSAEEQGKWEVLNEEMDVLDKRIKSALDAEQRQADAEAAYNKLHDDREGKREGGGGGGRPESRRMNDEIRAFLRGESGAPRVLEIARTDNSRLEWNYGPVNYRTLTGPGPAGTGGTGAGASLIPVDFYDQRALVAA